MAELRAGQLASATVETRGDEAGGGAGPRGPLDDLGLCHKAEKSRDVELVGAVPFAFLTDHWKNRARSEAGEAVPVKHPCEMRLRVQSVWGRGGGSALELTLRV